MAKPNALQAVLDKQASTPEPPAPQEPAAPPHRRKPRPKRAAQPSSRRGTTLIGGHFPEPIARQLRLLAAEEGTTNQELIREALDLLFTKKGKKRIDELAP